MASQNGGRRGEPEWWEVYALSRAGGATQAEASAAANISERHARRQEKEQAGLRLLIGQMRSRAFEAESERLQRLVGRTIDSLEALLGCGEMPAVQLGAANAILKNVLLFRNQVLVEERLQALERKLLGEGGPSEERVSDEA